MCKAYMKTKGTQINKYQIVGCVPGHLECWGFVTAMLQMNDEFQD